MNQLIRSSLFLFFLFFFSHAVTFAWQDPLPARFFTSISLLPTPVYLHYKGKECRMVRLVFREGKNYEQLKVQVSFNGFREEVIVPASQDGIKEFELPLPGDPINKDMQVTASVSVQGQVYRANCIIAPARKWSVYVLAHSHVDIGYTNLQSKVLKLHMDNIDAAIMLARKTQGYPAAARYKWNTEAMWVVDNYLKAADAPKKKAFWEAVRKGWIGLDGAYANINTSVTDSRQLLQMFYDATKEAKLNGVNINTLFQGDVPGFSIGLATQSAQTGIKYFLSGPNSSDRIGYLPEWQDKPCYLLSPSRKQKILLWQCQPYSIGFQLKGSKIPNFFTVEDPKPFYSGKPSENFLNPYLFDYLSGLEQKRFPYDMTILTWALSDNAPIDPELPDAVKAWNERYASPKLVITTTKQFFTDFEHKYGSQLPAFTGDYSEYWTDGLGSAARETGINRINSNKLQQVEAIWAIKKKSAFPNYDFRTTWKNILLFNEHTWGAYNSTSEPDDPKVKEEWKVKQAFALDGHQQIESLLNSVAEDGKPVLGSVDVYNTLSWTRTDLATIPWTVKADSNIVVNEKGEVVPSQRLSTGELVFVAAGIPPMSKKRFFIRSGSIPMRSVLSANGLTIESDLYRIKLDSATGYIEHIEKKGYSWQPVGKDFNKYIYLPGDSLDKILSAKNASIRIKEQGPVVVSLEVNSDAPGANNLVTEIRLIHGIDRFEVINTIDKKAIRSKEAVHFLFPFQLEHPQVRYNIPWGNVEAETDQLIHSNRNWYTVQRWVDISNKDYGVTLSTIEAPLIELGKITTAGLLGSLWRSDRWIKYTNQTSQISSWVMNNLWHTNFRAEQEGVATFHYYFTLHQQFNSITADRTGLENHRPLLVVPAHGDVQKYPLFEIEGTAVYAESIKPCYDGNGILIHLVNSSDQGSKVTFKRNQPFAIVKSNLLEDDIAPLQNGFILPAREIITIKLR